MSREYMEIGSAPCDEQCVAVDPKVDYLPDMRAECQRFLDLVRKTLGPEPAGARLGIRSNPHDFGTYLEVVCYYSEEDPEAYGYALLCESEAPRRWTDEAPVPTKRYKVEVTLEADIIVEAQSATVAQMKGGQAVIAKARAGGLEVDRHSAAAYAREVA